MEKSPSFLGERKVVIQWKTSDRYIKVKHENRFKKFNTGDYVVSSFMTLILAVGLYLSISFSVKFAQGYTLFGDSSSYSTKTIETKGPTSADIEVLVLYWVLTAALLALWVYYVFFRKIDHTQKPRKTIEDGKTVLLEEKDEKKDHEDK